MYRTRARFTLSQKQTSLEYKPHNIKAQRKVRQTSKKYLPFINVNQIYTAGKSCACTVCSIQPENDQAGRWGLAYMHEDSIQQPKHSLLSSLSILGSQLRVMCQIAPDNIDQLPTIRLIVQINCLNLQSKMKATLKQHF